MANTQAGRETVSAVISTFRANYTVETLTRIQRVTGQSYSISGDALLRHARNMLKQRLNKEYGKVAQ